jgi:hypothetical protein
LEAALLVLLMGVTYKVHRWDGLRCHESHTRFHEDLFKHSNNINRIASKIWEAAVLVSPMGKIYDVCMWMYKNKMDLWEIGWGGMDWIDLAQDREHGNESSGSMKL